MSKWENLILKNDSLLSGLSEEYGIVFVSLDELMFQLSGGVTQKKAERNNIIGTVVPTVSEPAKKKKVSTPPITDYMKIEKDENRVPLRNSVQAVKEYIQDILNCPEFEKMKSLAENSKKISSASVYQKKINQYTQSIQGMCFKYVSNPVKSMYKISELVVSALMDNVKSYIIQGIMESAVRRIRDNDDNSGQYIKLIESIRDYLSRLGFYTYNNVNMGQKLDDDDWDYFDNVPISISNHELNDIVRYIKKLPYVIEYCNEDGVSFTYMPGEVEIYQA